MCVIVYSTSKNLKTIITIRNSKKKKKKIFNSFQNNEPDLPLMNLFLRCLLSFDKRLCRQILRFALSSTRGETRIRYDLQSGAGYFYFIYYII